MANSCQVRANVLGSAPRIELSDDEAASLLNAIAVSRTAVEIEELYDGLIDNYIELEAAMLHAAGEYAVRPATSVDNFQDTRRLINRRLMHLLMFAKAYLDVVPRLAAAAAVDSDVFRRELKRQVGEKYDKHLGYRVMESLRNSAQHWGLPLHGIGMGGKWLARSEKRKGLIRHHVVATIAVEELRKNEKFKRSIINELAILGEKVDFRPLVREYVQCLSEVHGFVRSNIEDSVKCSEVLKIEAIDKWKAMAGDRGRVVGLCVVKMKSAHTWDVLEHLNDSANKQRGVLIRKNGRLPSLVRSFVSNSIDDDDV